MTLSLLSLHKKISFLLLSIRVTCSHKEGNYPLEYLQVSSVRKNEGKIREEGKESERERERRERERVDEKSKKANGKLNRKKYGLELTSQKF